MPPIYNVLDFGGNVCRNGDYMKIKSYAGLEKWCMLGCLMIVI